MAVYFRRSNLVSADPDRQQHRAEHRQPAVRHRRRLQLPARPLRQPQHARPVQRAVDRVSRDEELELHRHSRLRAYVIP